MAKGDTTSGKTDGTQFPKMDQYSVMHHIMNNLSPSQQSVAPSNNFQLPISQVPNMGANMGGRFQPTSFLPGDQYNNSDVNQPVAPNNPQEMIRRAMTGVYGSMQ